MTIFLPETSNKTLQLEWIHQKVDNISLSYAMSVSFVQLNSTDDELPNLSLEITIHYDIILVLITIFLPSTYIFLTSLVIWTASNQHGIGPHKRSNKVLPSVVQVGMSDHDSIKKDKPYSKWPRKRIIVIYVVCNFIVLILFYLMFNVTFGWIH